MSTAKIQILENEGVCLLSAAYAFMYRYIHFYSFNRKIVFFCLFFLDAREYVLIYVCKSERKTLLLSKRSVLAQYYTDEEQYFSRESSKLEQ